MTHSHIIEYFKELSIHPKNAEELKGLILQLAVEGKLTEKWREENPNVEPASELLKRIQEEKAQLIKEKKIKKEKALPEIEKDEIHFDIPSSWVWTRMQNYLDVRDGTHATPKYVEKGYPLVTSKNLYTKKLNLDNVKYISEEDHLEISKRSKVDLNDILFAMIGSIGNPVIVDIDLDFSIKNVALIKYYTGFEYCPYYILHYLNFKTPHLKSNSDGAVQSFISLTKLRNCVIAIPPLKEQKAIVQIVNQLFAEIEQLEEQTKKRIQLKEDFATSSLQQLTSSDTENAWTFLKPHFQTFFTTQPNVKKLREAILQLAVQGKLTHHWRKQNPNVEPASELLKRIQEEKAQLIKEKKVKKEKVLPEITEEEIPYELPEGWSWCRMQEVGLFQRGKSKHRPRNDTRLFENGIYPLVQTGDVSSAKKTDGIISQHKSMYNDFGLAQSKMWDKGTLCITIAANIAETGFLGYEACFPDSVVGFTTLDSEFISKYVEFFITVTKSDLEKYAPSTAQKNINLGILYELKFPLPPVEEIIKIVKIVNNLKVLCDQLETSLSEKEGVELDWMKSVING
ncbi:restriction endonuclease subunit S [Flammeovirga yaeyamensis]|uniref:Restriction endonuclease subunit S n=1 Tax=Flammeovirga yaeyamensis TaxID=367791 RepID=A0AAX1MZ57_9BACT|nr:restriction endonuclease subunit S [Flammeovirga yaeyamensis]MBB3695962.1 type I restriction enzyme S subunit [Flammeovirga yaeyamensis]NMF34649.1 restriction endonuclease subunit S [Flammeovirga yaeyamensis]QWG00522.1 restriction endonuclease subunit S [Flammeovirga yaeyamensis]